MSRHFDPPDKATMHRGVFVSEPRTALVWPDPTEEMLASEQFEAVWKCIKDWDIAVPAAYGGYSGATGNHVCAILDALAQQHKEKP